MCCIAQKKPGSVVASPSVKPTTLRPTAVNNPVHKEDRAGMANVHNQILAGVQLKSLKQRAVAIPSRHIEVMFYHSFA